MLVFTSVVQERRLGQIITEHWLKADLVRVFAFFSDPTNLPSLMPSEMAVRLEGVKLHALGTEAIKKVVQSGMNPAKSAGPGSLIQISFRPVPFLPFRAKWVAEILEYEPLSHFTDAQRFGPMRSWHHRHSFRAETRDGVMGTVVRDEVAYELPFGPLGRIADALLLERMMRKTFQSRQKELERLLT